MIGWLTSWSCGAAEQHGRRVVEQSKHPSPRCRFYCQSQLQREDRYFPGWHRYNPADSNTSGLSFWRVVDVFRSPRGLGCSHALWRLCCRFCRADVVVRNLLAENAKALKLYESEVLQTEIRVMYELLYVLNNSYRNNKTFKALQQVCPRFVLESVALKINLPTPAHSVQLTMLVFSFQVEQCINRLKMMKLVAALKDLKDVCPAKVQRWVNQFVASAYTVTTWWNKADIRCIEVMFDNLDMFFTCMTKSSRQTFINPFWILCQGNCFVSRWN